MVVSSLTREMLIIGAVRVCGALPVLRWPLAGAILAMAVDLSDLVLMNVIHMGGLGDYQRFDKAADLATMVTFMVVALRWTGPARTVAAVLFALRMVGVAAYEVTGQRETLLALPNVFEFWFVLVVARDRFAPDHELTAPRAARWLVVLTVAKMGQEYVLHVWRGLDNYSLPQVVAAIREWLAAR